VQEQSLEQADHEKNDKNKKQEKEALTDMLPPVYFKEVKATALSIRLHIMHNKIPSVKSIFSTISYSLEKFRDIIIQKFSLSEEEATKISRFIFEGESALLNNKIEYKADKSILATKLINEFKKLLSIDKRMEVSTPNLTHNRSTLYLIKSTKKKLNLKFSIKSKVQKIPCKN
jgi:hypothetical protein